MVVVTVDSEVVAFVVVVFELRIDLRAGLAETENPAGS